MYHLVLIFFALTFAAAGCDDTEPAAPVTTHLDAGGDGAVLTPARLEIHHDAMGQDDTVWALTLLAEPIDGGEPQTIVLADAQATWPVTFSLGALAPGSYRLTVFQDRSGDGVFEGCPFPPTPLDPLYADDLDNVQGVFEGWIGAGAFASLTLERRLCGPGDPGTGLEATLTLPDPEVPIEAPIWLQLDPVTYEGQDTSPTVQRFPILPDGLWGQTRIVLGELVPGRYRATVFADGDGDGRPSPCVPTGVGGGDRWMVSLGAERGELEIEVRPGARVTLPSHVLATIPGCVEALTGVSFSLTLSSEVAAGLSGGEIYDDTAPSAPLWLALLPEMGGAPVVSARLADGVDAVASRRFTVTGLPIGTWRLVVWADRDGDGVFGPCEGASGGLDRVWLRQEGVSVRAEEVRGLGALMLEAGVCAAEVSAGLRGAVVLEPEEGSVGSGRPVRLDLRPVDPLGEGRSLLLLDARWPMSDVETPFAREVALQPGRYVARIYLDTDRDGRFGDCREAAFGDRASAAPFEIFIGADGLLDVGAITVADLGCPVPETGLEPSFWSSLFVGGAEVGPLRLRIEEQGGWMTDLLIRASLQDLEGELEGRRIPLAPGRYALTAYLDEADDGVFGACDGSAPDRFFGEVEISIDAREQAVSPRFSVELGCRR